MKKLSWAKSDGESAAVVEYTLLDDRERYVLRVMPLRSSVLGSLWLERRSQVQLLSDVLLDLLNDGNI